MKKKAPAAIPVLVRVPPALLKKLDSACEAQGRSRTAELRIRLTESFKKPKAQGASA